MGRRATVTTIAGVVILSVAAIVVATSIESRGSETPGAGGRGDVPTATASIVRTDVERTRQVTGALSFVGAQELVDQSVGIALTALPSPGQVLDRGDTVFEVDGVSVPLFIGPRPSWRDLSIGVPDAPDVRQLEDNLVALGFADLQHLSIDEHFDAATARAVRQWQRAAGRPQTGTFAIGDVVWAPGPLRVASVDAVLGSPARPGAVVAHATGTTHVVTLDLSVGQMGLLAPGDPVNVQFPDGSSARGSVSRIDQVVTPDGSGSQGSNRQQLSVTVSVTLDDPTAGGSFDAVPITVDVVEASASDVLAVPINALVAPVEGGFAIEVVDASSHRLVPVRTGIFSRTMVEISGDGVAEGMTVVVPAS